MAAQPLPGYGKEQFAPGQYPPEQASAYAPNYGGYPAPPPGPAPYGYPPQPGMYPGQAQPGGVYPPQYGMPMQSTTEFVQGGGQPGEPEAVQPQFKGDASQWEDKAIRMGFIRKVYMLLTLMLLVICGIISVFIFVPQVGGWVRQNSWISIVSMVVALGLLIALACAGNLRRKAPWNYVFLFAFTIAEGVAIGAICSFYSVEEVLWALGITTLIVVGVSLFACQTKIDFTMKSGALVVVLFVLLGMGFLMIFFYSKWLHVIYASVGALVFGMFLIIDTQMIVGGSHQMQIHPEEYIFAALTLFVDIINIFLMVLQLVGLANN